ncbi:hypothetical protein [Nonomuraea turcica]|uniref:hypothetical protein n=1 Tax=Nonomuraea sp. G32 TaxID=3067274 RepID=UPI00273A76E3|nr:hypothetical protein [Nonomuraea sp. G32]MDP4501010.1 hypothetical protein [Nonomuraea sp. G32]
MFRGKTANEIARAIDAEAREWVATMRPTPHPYDQPGKPVWWNGPHSEPSEDESGIPTIHVGEPARVYVARADVAADANRLAREANNR